MAAIDYQASRLKARAVAYDHDISRRLARHH